MITPRKFRRETCPRCGSFRRPTRFAVCMPCARSLEWHVPEVLR